MYMRSCFNSLYSGRLNQKFLFTENHKLGVLDGAGAKKPFSLKMLDGAGIKEFI